MSYVEDVDCPQFSSQVTRKAAGDLTYAAYNNWIQPDRRVIPIDEDRGRDASRGREHRLSFRRVLQVVLTSELTRLGLPARRAGQAAWEFTHSGDGPSGWGDEAEDHGRDPGQLYADGQTVLIAYADETVVREVHQNTPLIDLFSAHGGDDKASAVIVNVNAIDARVRQTLGLSPAWGRTKRDGGKG